MNEYFQKYSIRKLSDKVVDEKKKCKKNESIVSERQKKSEFNCHKIRRAEKVLCFVL